MVTAIRSVFTASLALTGAAVVAISPVSPPSVAAKSKGAAAKTKPAGARLAAQGGRGPFDRTGRLAVRLHPRAGIADDADRHRTGKTDIAHARACRHDRGVLHDRQHCRHGPQSGLHGSDHAVDIA